jgi:uncharacterized protein with HEPN domain
MPWPDVVAMRNVLVHRYFGIDLQQVWDTVAIDLPQLKKDVQRVLTSLRTGPDKDGKVDEPGQSCGQ